MFISESIITTIQFVICEEQDFGVLEAVAPVRAAAPVPLPMTMGVQTLMAGMLFGVLCAGIRRI